MADRRRKLLLAAATGATLEIGAGTGLNLAHYPPTVSELVLAEPGSTWPAGCADHLARASRPVEVVEAPAERLPFHDERFDTVVCTLVLCTVPDPPAALAEAARVLRPERAPAVPRARSLRRPAYRPLAGPSVAPLAVHGRRLQLQPRHGGDAASIGPDRR